MDKKELKEEIQNLTCYDYFGLPAKDRRWLENKAIKNISKQIDEVEEKGEREGIDAATENYKKNIVPAIKKQLLKEVETKFVGKSPAFLEPHLKKGYTLAMKIFGEVVKELSNE